jgi:hypothetical protein
VYIAKWIAFFKLLLTAFRNAWANSIHTKSDDDTSSRKMLYPVGGKLYPICWSHVRETLTYMDSLGTVVRPCALNTDAVYLTSRGKMGDASMSAVVSQRTLHFMIHCAAKPMGTVFSTNPVGTIEYLKDLVELKTNLVDTSGMMKYTTADDARLHRVESIFRKFVSITRELTRRFGEGKKKQELALTFVPPQALHALKVVVTVMPALLRQVHAALPEAPGMPKLYIAAPNTGTQITL